ncbi:MAG: formyltetrahydrofolate deformylase, partial [Actinotalea sp.]|nr:formyltetrahydrofolate deformylase [Actinotalea sp.]
MRRSVAGTPPPVASALVTDVTSPAAGEATHWVLSLSCPDRPGIVHAVAGLLAEHGGNITESQQFGDPLSGLFFMRVQVESAASDRDLRAALTELARTFGMTWQL